MNTHSAQIISDVICGHALHTVRVYPFCSLHRPTRQFPRRDALWFD